MRCRKTFDLPVDGRRIKGNLHTSNRTRQRVILVSFYLAIPTEMTPEFQASGTVRRGTTTTVPSGSW